VTALTPQRVANRAAVAVEQTAADRDPLADRFARVLAGEVVVERTGAELAELRPGDLADGGRQVDERLRGVAQPRRAVAVAVERRMEVLVTHGSPGRPAVHHVAGALAAP